MRPVRGFILAAGLGTRLRPLTDERPKPMVEIGGRPMIDYALAALADAGVQHCVVNTHYKAEVLEAHLAGWKNPVVTISHEETLLDTGGGIKNALAHFDAPFFVLSGDSVWQEAVEKDGGAQPGTLGQLAAAWDPEKMDILMVLQPVATMKLTKGVGDYDLGPDGRAVRSLLRQGEFMFTSIRINRREIFENAPEGAFSYLTLLDAAQARGRLYGLVNRGAWHHISTPEDVRVVNAAWESGEA
ncbi:MAG: nucleotidyltransferase family protein [Alphaproteobacteria bacterium]|nr:nucleotidyltransferase family protein [Alphaproteobacteria bacterium]